MRQSIRATLISTAMAAAVVTGMGMTPATASTVPARQAAVQSSTVAAPAARVDHYAKGKVTSRGRLAIRAMPTTHSRRLGWLRSGQIVDIKCWTWGESVKGDRRWYRLGISTKEWVAGRYIRIVKGKVPHC
ncbi:MULTISPECIES: hypothetical protein [Thermomonosporaceae]|uniref:hypothetical protein n=1 Tax=Thermomonosporaceae TaxID=2012 RepID=UPI00255AA6D9|nr:MULTISPECIES: hypothetical protein [Thermomonosporaceae]MDL4777372.1 hypothetical protein [Actinomadura xylanilytica]